MEYAGFGSNYLQKKIYINHKPIKEEKLQLWAQDILNAIWYIHKRGVIHTDIKISNILIQTKSEEAKAQEGLDEEYDEIPEAKICDFGLCHLIDPDKKLAHMKCLVGTEDY